MERFERDAECGTVPTRRQIAELAHGAARGAAGDGLGDQRAAALHGF